MSFIMQSMIRRTFLVGLATLALAACGTTPPMERPAATLPPPLALDVATIEIVSSCSSITVTLSTSSGNVPVW